MNIDDKNKNGQRLLRKTDKRSTTHPFAKIWVMECLKCGNHYGSNSCDAHNRRCPACNKTAAKAEPI
jgi:hypothetical protein